MPINTPRVFFFDSSFLIFFNGRGRCVWVDRYYIDCQKKMYDFCVQLLYYFFLPICSHHLGRPFRHASYRNHRPRCSYALCFSAVPSNLTDEKAHRGGEAYMLSSWAPLPSRNRPRCSYVLCFSALNACPFTLNR